MVLVAKIGEKTRARIPETGRKKKPQPQPAPQSLWPRHASIVIIKEPPAMTSTIAMKYRKDKMKKRPGFSATALRAACLSADLGDCACGFSLCSQMLVK